MTSPLQLHPDHILLPFMDEPGYSFRFGGMGHQESIERRDFVADAPKVRLGRNIAGLKLLQRSFALPKTDSDAIHGHSSNLPRSRFARWVRW